MDPHARRMMRQVIAAGGVLLVLLVVLTVLRVRRHSYAAIPPSQSQFLRDVAEPITMVEAMAWDDGGSVGLTIKDSKGQPFSVCLMESLEDDRHLRVGSAVPGQGRALPIAGVEEQAFLGLLERWAEQDPDAKNWSRKFEAARKVGMRGSVLRGDESPEQRANAIAVGRILKGLRLRN